MIIFLKKILLQTRYLKIFTQDKYPMSNTDLLFISKSLFVMFVERKYFEWLHFKKIINSGPESRYDTCLEASLESSPCTAYGALSTENSDP